MIQTTLEKFSTYLFPSASFFYHVRHGAYQFNLDYSFTVKAVKLAYLRFNYNRYLKFALGYIEVLSTTKYLQYHQNRRSGRTQQILIQSGLLVFFLEAF